MERPRIVLLVVLDTLAAGHVSHLGYHRRTTPNIDALAAEGVSFESALTPATYTLAAIPSLLTGLLPDRHGVTAYRHRLAPEQTTMAELLARAGYRTFGAGANLNGGPRYGNDGGFEEWIEVYLGPGPDGAQRAERHGEEMHLPRADEFPPILRARLERLQPGERLFAYLHVREPHGPYDAPESFHRHFVDEHTPQPFERGDRKRIQADIRGLELPPPHSVAEVVRMYDFNVLWADDQLGRMLDELRRLGLYEDALIVVTSDHGEAFWQHGLAGHGRGLFEEEARIPLVFKLPSSMAAARGLGVRAQASLLDVLPTLGELLDLPVPERALDGRSLLPHLLGREADEERELLLRAYDSTGRFALRTRTEKAIARVAADEWGARRIEALELYDLALDPLELRDLAAEEPERALRAGRRILEILAALEPTSRPHGLELTGSELHLLTKLGYAGGEDSGER